MILFKTLIVGTPKNRLAEAVLTSTYNPCFGAKIRKIGILQLYIPQFYSIKVGYEGVLSHGHVFLMRMMPQLDCLPV